MINGHYGKASLPVNKSTEFTHSSTCAFNYATKIVANYAMTQLRSTEPCQYNTGGHTAQEVTVGKNTCKVVGWEEI